ncbi:MAG: helix-turn-helix domain-containing protein [Minwuia sp.]|uniref:helix-turn-helix domain-containing protein n=1 Tax=Minwuia sp. TaxID=2493630 RepID=UPI003A8BB225
MTPFGARVRELREKRGISLRRMAADLEVTPAYLSALEHGHRSRPNWALVQRIIAYFELIWDDADELQDLAAISHPRIVIDTAGLTPEATAVANRLAQRIGKLPPETLRALSELLESGEGGDGGETGESGTE